jgi:acylphosphatase
VEKENAHQSVNWYAYFKSIRVECPWSYAAYIKGEIDIVDYQGTVKPLGKYQARVYIVNAPDETVEALAAGLDYEGEDEWLFSYPGYGPYAAPVSILIQQNRAKLRELRKQQDASS